MSLVNVTNLSYKYNTIEIFNGIGFTTEDGEIFALLGPSAGGRTTGARAAGSPALGLAYLHGIRPTG